MATDEEIKNDIEMFDERMKKGIHTPVPDEIQSQIRTAILKSRQHRESKCFDNFQQSPELAFA
jgi:hypothetical protein